MNSLHPGLILILTGVITLLIPDKRIRNGVALLGAVFAFFAFWMLEKDASLQYVFISGITFDLLRIDGLSWLFGLIFSLIAVICGIYSLGTTYRGEKCASLIYAGSSIGVVLAGDWISFICFWEMMAVASCYLVWAGKTQDAVRASYRYLVFHLVGGNLLLAGTVLLCAGGNFSVELIGEPTSLGPWLIFLGVAINAAMPPFHTWAKDAYPESTPSGTVYMGSFTTKVAIYALIRLFAGTQWLVPLGAVMAVFGACMALLENDLRRLLSYHIVSQLGMMIAALGTGLAEGIDGAALHGAYNILYKGVLLMGAGAIFTVTGKRKISDLAGLYRKMPLTAICFLIGSLAIAGMPLLNGFTSKALIMDALHNGHFTFSYWMVTLAGVGTWLSITLKINYFVFFRKEEKAFSCKNVPIHMQAAMVVCTGLCIITGLFPQTFYGLTPFGTTAHPFTFEHIAEYAALFIGATGAFILFRKRMEPHDVITLDVDWIYRRPFVQLLMWCSHLVHAFFVRADKGFSHYTAVVKYIIKHPAGLFRDIGALKGELMEEDEEGAFEGDMPVGAFMQIFIVFCIVAFIVILILE